MQVGYSRFGFFLYRFLMAILSATLLAAHFTSELYVEQKTPREMAVRFVNLVELILASHFAVSFVIILRSSMLRICCSTRDRGVTKLQWNHSEVLQILFDRPESERKYFKRKVRPEALHQESEAKESRTAGSENELKWYHVFSCLLHQISFVGALTSAVLYVIQSTRQVESRKKFPEEYLLLMQHILLCIIMIVDAIICNIPVRFMHFIYSSLCGSLYGVILFAVQRTRMLDNVYWFHTRTWVLIGWCIALVPAVMLFQVILLFIHNLSRHIYSRCFGKTDLLV